MYERLRQEVFDACQMLPRTGLAILTWGNVSRVDRKNEVIAIKPSGVPYDMMKPEDIVVCDLQGRVVDGHLRPSSDLPTHVALYAAWPQVEAIVHTHSPWATMLAQAGIDLKPFGTTHADTFYGPVPCTRPLARNEVDGDYELETGRVILETFQERGIAPDQVPAVLVASHGPFAWGHDAKQAVENALVLEQCAWMAVFDRLMDPEVMPVPAYLLDRHYQRKHGEHATYGQR
ncbi:L-ribulose-5-phosphate 4-epimerase AraD [Dubosiella muris]|uniref:L-ribulose-5-phosphate 4-epimerase AraD n=1 Tax=Dubosiella muris TaxID=3038133 RepID=A0AC61R8D1_9FIRM|nr:L-ribulose-5-phosphate 4-epimerase AraD [Dubosiella muris]TGY66218.1 L-ribulose-5-phosphate 4-epimerase AraD [Dubosiella muris]